MTTHRVLVFGSRDWADVALIRRRLVRFHPGTVVIHGAARGADSIAADVADSLGLTVVAEPADWAGLGKRAGPERNQRMIDAHGPTCALGFMTGWTPGSVDMLRRLMAAGVPVDACSRPVPRPR